jgi:flagella basal body P-ring formation protein FlgA
LFLSVLTVPADVTIDVDTIQLGALIPFTTGDPRASISLGYAPNPGLARRLTKEEILKTIVLAGHSTGDLVLPDSILVHRRGARLDRDEVIRAVLDAFILRFPEADIEITNISIPALQIGSGPVEIKVSLPPRFDPAGPVFARVEVRGFSFTKTIFVRTSVRVEANQPVLKSRVEAHSEIQPGDIEWKMTRMPADGMTGTIEGMLAKRDLQPGQILSGDLLYRPLYVRKGDSVTVKATAGAVTVAATMRAKAAGKLGDTIPVEHLSGKGTATARIVGPGILEVSQ